MKKKLLTMVMAANLTFAPLAVFANQRFSDVPDTHWAYTAIANMADGGFMVPNSAGEFRPDQPIDKFETARILAIVAGFRHIGNTPEQESFINQAVDNHSALLAELGKTYTRWNSTSNREISYLLEKGILTPDDLQSFIVIHEGAEHLRALSRGEAAVFLVRAVGLADQANAGVYSELFADDSNIPAEARVYVYFLRANAVVSGNDSGQFEANTAVTRAALASMLDRTMALSYALQNDEPAKGDTNNTTNDNTGSQGGVSSADNRAGIITVLYPAINAVQIQTTSASSIHRLSPSVNININGVRGTFEQLTVGMSIEVELVENTIISLNATSPSGGVVTLQATPPTNPQTPTNPTTPTPLPEPLPSQPEAPRLYTTLQALVSEVDNVHNRLIVNIEFVAPSGDVMAQDMAFDIVNSTEIALGENVIPLDQIKKGDMVTLKVSGGTAYEVTVVERFRSFVGTVEERISSTDNNVRSFVIRDKNSDLKSTFVVTDDTILEREGSGKVTWNRIRIGDTVEIVAEQNAVVSIYAFGDTSLIEGVVEQLTLRQDVSTVVINDRGTLSTYYITGVVEGMNEMRIGSRVRFRLESREVETITIINL